MIIKMEHNFSPGFKSSYVIIWPVPWGANGDIHPLFLATRANTTPERWTEKRRYFREQFLPATDKYISMIVFILYTVI